MNVTPADVSLAVRRELGGREIGLALGALGVVYGDLGTNPLFALRECFASNHPPSFGYFGMPIERVIEIGMQLEL